MWLKTGLLRSSVYSAFRIMRAKVSKMVITAFQLSHHNNPRLWLTSVPFPASSSTAFSFFLSKMQSHHAIPSCKDPHWYSISNRLNCIFWTLHVRALSLPLYPFTLLQAYTMATPLPIHICFIPSTPNTTCLLFSFHGISFLNRFQFFTQLFVYKLLSLGWEKL